MPRKAKTRVPDAEPVDALPEFGIVEADQLPEDVENVISQIGDDVTTVILYRRGRGESRQSYIASIAADEFSLDDVARRWGGGRYLARLTGKNGIIKGMTFQIDESLKAEPVDARRTGNTVTGDSSLTERLLEAVLLRSNPQSQRDPMEIAAAMAAASAQQSQAMVAAMMGAMTPLLAKITELSTGRAGGDMTPEQMLQLIEFGAERLGGEGGGYGPVLREVGIPLVRAIEAGMGRTAARPNPPLTAAEGTTPVPANPNAPPWVAVLAPYIPTFQKFAERKDDPGMWAAVMEAQQPKLVAWLDEQVIQPGFAAQVFVHFPQLAGYREWVEEFLAHFGPEVDDDDEPEGDEIAPEKEA
jgi:hypothetical protein